jgi:hypothetical protein
VLWSALLVAMSLAGLGAAYLALWWVLPAAAALLASALRPRRAFAWLLLALVPGALLTAEAAILLVGFFMPLAGRMASPAPMDPLIAALVALPVALAAALAIPAALPARRLGTAAAALAVLGLAGTVGLALVPPYSAAHPKRLHLAQTDGADGTSRLTVSGGDALDVAPLLRGLPFRMEAGGEGRVAEGAVPPAAVPAPRARVASSPVDPATGTRTVRVRVEGGEYRRLVLAIPRERIAGWSLTPALPPGDAPLRARIIPGRGRPWEATVQVRGAAPVQALLTAVYEPAPAGAPLAVEARLPPWVVTSTRLDRAVDVRL